MIMKKLISLFAICAAATVLAVLALINNVVVIIRWWRAFVAAGGDGSAMTTEICGVIPWLDWTAVDYSAATTFIPALGFLCMTLSVLRLMRGKPLRGEDFPFFKGSDQLNVALGLFGTLWGIIVIGYFKLDTVTMADLMQCLHTALFSTLMAVVWVFIIDRPLVRPFFQKILEKSGLAETNDGDLADAVDRLIGRLREASEAFDRRQRAFEKAFSDRQAEFEAGASRREAEFDSALKERLMLFCDTFASQLREAEEAAIRRQKSADEASE